MTDYFEREQKALADKRPSETWEEFRDRATDRTERMIRDVIRVRVMHGYPPTGPTFHEPSEEETRKFQDESRRRLLALGWKEISPTEQPQKP